MSVVASTPSTLTAFTSFEREPSETYPIAAGFPATVVSITDVEFVISALTVVISLSSSSTTPISSTNAPLVPEPSSREITDIGPVVPSGSVCSSCWLSVFGVLFCDEEHAATPKTITDVINKAKIFFFMFNTPLNLKCHFQFHVTDTVYKEQVKSPISHMLNLC